MVFFLYPLWWKIRGLWKPPDRRDWLRRKLVLDLMCVFHNSLIQFPVVGWGYVPSLLFDLRPNYGGGNQDTGDLFQKVPCTHYSTQCPRPCSRPLLTHTSDGDSCAGVQLQQPGNQPEGVSSVSRRWRSLWLTVPNYMFISSIRSSFILWQKH